MRRSVRKIILFKRLNQVIHRLLLRYWVEKMTTKSVDDVVHCPQKIEVVFCLLATNRSRDQGVPLLD